ncbi:MAG: hypothetical protein DRO09_01505 [Thermoprotei archaeon]|nr:MAG: hypothetical protein DRO09_01505 [Thermoprotei archaeon]
MKRGLKAERSNPINPAIVSPLNEKRIESFELKYDLEKKEIVGLNEKRIERPLNPLYKEIGKAGTQ